MVKQEGRHRIAKIQKQWMLWLMLQHLALSLGLALIFAALAIYLFDWPAWVFPIFFLVLFSFLSILKPFWKLRDLQICRYLNEKYPELEESAALLLKPIEACSPLEGLQQHKINEVIIHMPAPELPFHQLKWAGLVLFAGIVMSFGISFLKPLADLQAPVPKENIRIAKEKVLPEIASFSLLIKAPAYTGVPERKQSQFAIRAEEGALLKWNIRTTIPVKVMKLIFNDQELAVLKPQDKEGKVWTYFRTIRKPGFYQVELDGKKSELYLMSVIPDLPALIRISHPKPHTNIDYGQAQQVRLNLTISDDYGLRSAHIAATMASGKGEGVSFTERKLDFKEAVDQLKSVSLSKLIDLKALGMKPGDELYFYVKAFDNHGQMSRSDVYFVSIVDTAELMSMAGMTNGVNLVPEYFRSQRQIIIDTEKLLAEKATLTEDAFKNRSNDLGMDQKLLRLRYGKFLGEESETEIGADHDHKEGDQHDHDEHEVPEKKFGDVQAIMDSYAHKHDIAEDATFFEPELKAQLKAVLTEMWKSELQLRTYKTRDALPFEYKALRLLKDLQQKSRAYVAKTTVKVSQLKEDKRLSGELDKIGTPVQNNSFEPQEKQQKVLKEMLGLLENRKAGMGEMTAKRVNKMEGLAHEERQLMQETEQYMILSASDHPELFLPALAVSRKLMSGNNSSTKDIALLQKAILKMLGAVNVIPQLPNSAPASTLAEKYFNQLKKGVQ
ncbi:hypothetical protein [Pedobacter gandavensis]|uniref:hypothetical protein n=1 Tax=Pedobacter gandavensis TaxID=2679963 RepID=UPI0029305DF2|nr:hypothetical protein [Pedobacter gandavensis]